MASPSMNTTAALILLAGIVLTGIAFIYRKKKRQWTPVGHVGALVIYPIKSCHGIEVSTAQCTPLGLKSGILRDRTFMILTEEGKMLSPVENPSMAVITPTFVLDEMLVDAPGMKTLKISIPELENQNGKTVCASFKGMQMQGYDCGNHYNIWFQQYLNNPELRLIYFKSGLEPTFSHKKLLVGSLMRKTDMMVYAYTTSYMLMTEPSINDLNQRLEKPAPYMNFRPNIVVKDSIPYHEENWCLVQIGSDAILKTLKLCQRCSQVNVNATTGEKDPLEPLKTLRSYHLCKDKNLNRVSQLVAPILGLNMGLNNSGTISVGDTVYASFK